MTTHSVPEMTTDEEAEAFLAHGLSDLDFARFQPLDWERLPKTARISLHVPEALVVALKARAKERGIPPTSGWCARPSRRRCEGR